MVFVFRCACLWYHWFWWHLHFGCMVGMRCLFLLLMSLLLLVVVMVIGARGGGKSNAILVWVTLILDPLISECYFSGWFQVFGFSWLSTSDRLSNVAQLHLTLADLVFCWCWGFLVNGSWLADGCELLVLSSINTILATEWGLSPLQKGLLLPFGQDLEGEVSSYVWSQICELPTMMVLGQDKLIWPTRHLYYFVLRVVGNLVNICQRCIRTFDPQKVLSLLTSLDVKATIAPNSRCQCTATHLAQWSMTFPAQIVGLCGRPFGESPQRLGRRHYGTEKSGLDVSLSWTDTLWYNIMIEGSLEVKLPTIWTDEKQSRPEAERRERSEEKRVKERE